MFNQLISNQSNYPWNKTASNCSDLQKMSLSWTQNHTTHFRKPYLPFCLKNIPFQWRNSVNLQHMSKNVSSSLFFWERWGIHESHCAPTMLSGAYSLCQAVWVMKVTEKTPALNHCWQRGRGTESWGGRDLMGETHNKATNLWKLSLTVTGQEDQCY